MKTETGVSHANTVHSHSQRPNHGHKEQLGGGRTPEGSPGATGAAVLHDDGRTGHVDVHTPDAAPSADEAWLMGAGILAATLAAQAKTIRELNRYIDDLEREVRVLRGQ